MKGNIIFAALLVLIITIGFYFVPVGIFIDDENTVARTVIPRDSDQEQAIYLTANKSPSPMDIFEAGRSQPVKGLAERRNAAAALAAAMSLYSDSTAISAEEGERLVNLWRITSSGLFCISKWKHKNLRENVQYLDCIIDPDGLSIRYIRYYNDDEPKMSAYDMNAALDRLDDYSVSFYGDIDQYLSDLMPVYAESDNNYALIPTVPNIISGIENYPEIIEPAFPSLDYYSLFDCFSQRCNAMTKLLVENGMDTPLNRFWLDSLAFMNISIGWSNTDTVLSTMNRIQDTSPMNASYTAQNSRIWQTYTLADGGTLTIIYNMAKDEVEGFFVT